MANHTFAERLKEALNNKQMKQVDLVRCAQEQGVKLGKSHVSQYLSGKTIPRAEILHYFRGTGCNRRMVDGKWRCRETNGSGSDDTGS